MPKLAIRLAPLLVAALPLVTLASGRPAAADLVVTHAKVYTADARRSLAGAFAVRGGRIVFVGSSAGAKRWTGPATDVRDLGGRLVLPGLFDSHIHPVGIVDLDVCDLELKALSLAELTDFVRGCIERYRVPAGEWVTVRHWNLSNGNQPDAAHPTLRAALDLASREHPIQLLGYDGHHSAFNSLALARAKNAAGATVGLSKATLAGDFSAYTKLVGVDAAGEPNGTVNEDVRTAMGAPDLLSVDYTEVMKAPSRVTERLNAAGITGIMDAMARPDLLELYDTLERDGKLTVRATLAQFYDPDAIRTPAGAPDWDRMLAAATAVRAKYAHDPLLRADVVKLFADGVLEGNPLAVPPTPPDAAVLRPYLQPIFARGADGRVAVVGYVDTDAPLCADVRARHADYAAAPAAAAFLNEHGYHPDQCLISNGQLQHERAVILEFAKRFHKAGFALHIHAMADRGVRTAIDAIEAARAADGVSSQHDALAHVQLVHPDDVARIGRDHLYLAFTYSWAFADPEYDLSVVPFFDRVSGGDAAALHPPKGYYEQNAYPVRSLRDAGAILIAGSDAPIDTRDPRPFLNMAMAVTRRFPGHAPLNPSQGITIRDAIDAYTINGARFLNREREAGSIEAGKSADFLVVDQDILALADAGNTDEVAKTRVLETWFMGKQVYSNRTH